MPQSPVLLTFDIPDRSTHRNDQSEKTSFRASSTSETMLMDQEILPNTVCASGGRKSVSVDRVDSGIWESSTGMSEARAFLSRDSDQIRHCNKPSLHSPPKDYNGTVDAILQQSETNSHAENDISKSSMPTLPRSTRPSISQRNITRRSSGPPGSHRGPKPPSRRSSFAAAQSINSYSRRPLFPNRSISAAHDGSWEDDPFLVHRRSMQIFQTFENLQGEQFRRRPDGRRSLVSPSLPDLPRAPSTVVTTEQGFAFSQAEDADPDLQHQHESHVPATVIDWTLPSTRRLEYREIDKSCQGFRGIWRRLAPRWCRRDSRLSFFDGNDSDAGSVRRYRLDLPEVEKENITDGVEVTEQEIDFNLGKTKRKWGCLGFRDWPGKS